MRLIIVSNRVAAPGQTGKGETGGLAAALTEAFEMMSGIWFGWSGKIVERPSPTPRRAHQGGLDLALVDLSSADRSEYYAGYANRGLWPIMHQRIGLSRFSRSDYAGYLRVNRWFAEALQTILEPDDLIWVHDFHLLPLAQELRALGVRNPIGYFHHIPWPPRATLATLPGTDQLVRGLADYDLLGVQTEADLRHLVDCLQSEAGAVPEGADACRIDGKRVHLGVYPIGIDAKRFQDMARKAMHHRVVRETAERTGSGPLLIGVDRLDYSKGIPQRIEAFERFITANPDQRGRATLLQIAPPSRADIPEYAVISRTVVETAGKVNAGLGEPGWMPINFIARGYPRQVLAGLYRIARVGVVTPLADGMNLVAKEYVAAQNPADPGVLVLSKFAGAAAQLRDALIVNPYDLFEVGEAMREAIFMDLEERTRRWEAMYEILLAQGISWWAKSFLNDLSAAATELRQRRSVGGGRPIPSSACASAS